MIIFKNKISTIEYDEESKNVTYWEHGIVKKDLLIEQLKAVLEFSKHNPVSSIIVDIRKLQGSFKSAFDFLHTEYYPILKSRGLTCKAFIVSEDLINNFLSKELVTSLNKHGIEAAIFSDPELASNWTKKN